MKNRYTNKLKEYNQQILALTPANHTLRLIMAYEFYRLYKTGMKVIDIGVGEGDSAQHILELSKAHIDLLDVNQEMIIVCKKKLSKYKKRITYICEDAHAYLKRSSPYDIICSSWTIHNFQQKDKIKILEAIYASLSDNGTFLLFDKVYPVKGGKELLERQCKRYEYVRDSFGKDIINHEYADFDDNYRQDEKTFLTLLKKVGFRNIKIIDRVERDVVITASK